jgi:hypothetical protein
MNKFKINNLNWQKRRSPTKEPKPISIEVPDFKKELNFKCNVITQYDDGIERVLFGRVLYNEIKKEWSINGIANGGFVVSATII